MLTVMKTTSCGPWINPEYSGSTKHITQDKTRFIQLRNLDEDIYITIGNQIKEPAHGIGGACPRHRRSLPTASATSVVVSFVL